MTLLTSGESGDPCGAPASLACTSPSAMTHDARLRVAPDQGEHLLVVDPRCDHGHQRAVLDAVKERVQIDVTDPLVTSRDVAASRQHRLFGRPSPAKPNAR